MKQAESKRKYRVLINGRNFLLNMAGKTQKTGFYTTRFVEAEDVKQAEAVAIELIKRDPKVSDIVVNKGGDTPMLHVEEVEEVKRLRSQVGYAFYSEEEDTE